MSFLYPQSWIMETQLAPQSRYRGSCGTTYLDPDVYLSEDPYDLPWDLDLVMMERSREARRQRALHHRRQRDFAQLMQQLAMEEVERQRREQRRRVLEAKKAALAEARRQEAAERRRAEAARQRHLAHVRAARIQHALLEEEERMARPKTTSHYVQVGNLLLHVVQDASNDNTTDTQETAKPTDDSESDAGCEHLQSLVADAPHEEAETAPTLATLSVHGRHDNEEASVVDALVQACEAVATPAANDPTGETPAESPADASAAATDATDASAASQAAQQPAATASSDTANATSPTTKHELLFSYDFPSNSTEYGRAIREHVHADSITVQASSENGGVIRIGGLWRQQAPPRTPSSPSSPRSPRSPHVSDVDENGEEVIVPEPPASTAASSKPELSLAMDECAEIPLPTHLDTIRAELTDEGFRLWHDTREMS